jgi:hypothetical protein
MNLAQWAFVLLTAGAFGGILFAMLVTVKVRYPRWFGAGHGLLGLTGVAMMGIALLRRGGADTHPSQWWAYAAVVAALLGGATLFRFLSPLQRPLLLVAAHGALALVGLWFLFPTVFGAVAG